VLKCDDVRKSSPTDVLTLIGKPVLYDVYYKDYDCSFIECLNKDGDDKFLVLLSLKANEFFKTIQNVFWALSGVGLILILISVKGSDSKLKILGITLLSVGIPILILTLVKDYFISLPAGMENIGGVIFDILFISFLIVTVIGLILTVVGCLLKLLPSKKRKKK
jgi:cellulose synthase/poly-beta-1,6-N-acetylglucosamine synthase-like glycosyltransferase